MTNDVTSLAKWRHKDRKDRPPVFTPSKDKKPGHLVMQFDGFVEVKNGN